MAKGSIFAVAGAILVVGGTTVIQILKSIPLAKVYDTTMVGFYFGSVLMFIAIFKYKLLDAETLAREYVIDELSEGIIAVNEKGDVNFSNVPALSLFPDLIKEPREVVNTIRNTGSFSMLLTLTSLWLMIRRSIFP